MIPKNKQDDIIKAITTVLQGETVGMVILRAGDGSLVPYIDDKESVIRNAHKLQDGTFKGGN